MSPAVSLADPPPVTTDPSVAAEPVQIGGVAPLTSVDFPNHLAAVVFCQGCPWRCRYCHNPHLQLFSQGPNHDAAQKIRWTEVVGFLEERRGFLDGVVFSGGEPTFQKDLPRAMQEVRAMGFEVGLHTAGPDPDRLEATLPWVNWVGMDIKAPFDERYDRITGRIGSALSVQESLRRLLKSGVAYQLRTTIHSALIMAEDLEDIHRALDAMGAKLPAIQTFRSEGCADEGLCQSAILSAS